MANPIVIKAYDYPPGIDISNAYATVKLQRYVHANMAASIDPEPLIIQADNYSPVGEPNILAKTTTNLLYKTHLLNPQQDPLLHMAEFDGLRVVSERYPIDYFSFTGFSASRESFAMFLFDKTGTYKRSIENIDGIQSNPNSSACTGEFGPPCFSYVYGTTISDSTSDIYQIDIGCVNSGGSINALTVRLK